MANLVLKGEELALYLAERMGVEPKVIRNSLERQQLAQVMAQLAATAAEQGAA